MAEWNMRYRYHDANCKHLTGKNKTESITLLGMLWHQVSKACQENC